MVKWFDEHIALPLKKNGILITFSSTSINNSLKKPGTLLMRVLLGSDMSVCICMYTGSSI